MFANKLECWGRVSVESNGVRKDGRQEQVGQTVVRHLGSSRKR
jgi:hypothetical protein